MPDLNFQDLFGGNDTSSGIQTAALMQAIRQRRAAGMLGLATGDPAMSAMGNELNGEANQYQQTLVGAVRARPQYAMESEQAKQAKLANDAWADPAMGPALRGVLGQFMPNMNLPEDASVPVMRNLLGPAEKYAQSWAAMASRNKLQDRYDPVTKQHYLFDPMSGASFSPDGRPLTSPVRTGPGAPMGTPPPSAVPRTGGSGNGRPPGAPPNPNAPEPTRDPRASKWEDELKKDLDAASASSRSAFGSTANIIFRGARILPLLLQKNPDGTPRQPTQQEWQDISAALVAMQTNGVPPEQMTLNAMPRDIAGDVSKIKSWLSSAPQAPDRQAWIERFVSNIQREEEQAKAFQRNAQLQRVAMHSDYANNFPKRMKQNLRAYGLDPSIVDQIRAGTYAPPAAEGGAGPASAPAISEQDRAAKAWADANPNDPRAAKIRDMLKTKGL